MAPPPLFFADQPTSFKVEDHYDEIPPMCPCLYSIEELLQTSSLNELFFTSYEMDPNQYSSGHHEYTDNNPYGYTSQNVRPNEQSGHQYYGQDQDSSAAYPPYSGYTRSTPGNPYHGQQQQAWAGNTSAQQVGNYYNTGVSLSHQHGASYAAGGPQGQGRSHGASATSEEPESPSSPSGGHEILSLPSPDPQSIWKWVQFQVVRGQPMFLCRWPGCDSSGFLHDENAFDHVRGHIQLKRYICGTCNIEFATLQTAKRHRDMQERSYACEFW
ncbi:hypothetical protein M422DRAFT_44367 [Sphaerobolus stellatus SS14]|nr:hypothetical protein M422DRAFT_44367 [Sphaerobolus stellatus SS14]